MFIHHDPHLHFLLPLQHMTREEITRMAQEAGFVGFDGENKCLREFAALVAAASASVEREACCSGEVLNAANINGNEHPHQVIEKYRAAIRARGQT